LRFLVDMPVTPQAVARLEAMGHDALHASTAGLGSEDDTVILERARIDDRIVVTADLLAQSGTLELERSITVVDQHRIRRRSLPIED
jgi:predicted nuclease of predicted toxin-antitoxin system